MRGVSFLGPSPKLVSFSFSSQTGECFGGKLLFVASVSYQTDDFLGEPFEIVVSFKAHQSGVEYRQTKTHPDGYGCQRPRSPAIGAEIITGEKRFFVC